MTGEFARQIMPMAWTYSLRIANATLHPMVGEVEAGGEGCPKLILPVLSYGDPATNKTRSEGSASMSRAS
jgi:hypothetical protein